MKNILLLGLLSSLFFVGCSSKTIEIVEENPKQMIEVTRELNVEDVRVQREFQEETKKVELEKSFNEEILTNKVELKRKLDEEALTDSDKKLNPKEIHNYIIDENTPLILKNQSKERAYE